MAHVVAGLETCWVTDLPLPRTAQLRALGNGVVPQQAAYAVELLWPTSPHSSTPPTTHLTTVSATGRR